MTASPRQAPDDLAEPVMPYWGFCVDGPFCGGFYTNQYSIFFTTNIQAKRITGIYTIKDGSRLWRWNGKPTDDLPPYSPSWPPRPPPDPLSKELKDLGEPRPPGWSEKELKDFFEGPPPPDAEPA
jgi:hypothetical protein